MGKSILRSVGAIIGGVGMLLAACSGTKSSDPIGPDGAAGTSAGDAGAGGAGQCMAGTKRCDGLNVKLCDASGSKEIIAQTCMPTQSCSNGACVAGVCAPNTQFCKNNAVWKCDQNGASSLAEQCAIGLYCLAENDKASCSAQACTASQPVCDRNVATVCRSDGSGPVSGGVDCSDTKRACFGGQCRDVTCKDGERQCEHGDVYVCSHNGTDLALLSACHSDESCDGDMGSCRARICEPGKTGCDGTRVQTCNDFGSAWLPGSVDCSTDGKICALGGCKKQVCAASRSFCQDGNLYSCDSTGTTTTLAQTCNPQSEHCITFSSGSGYCEKNLCKAGENVCDGNTVKVCNADGSLPVSGTLCGGSQYCENGQCKDLPCTPGNYFCKGADVYYCDFASPYMYLTQTCAAETTCKAWGTSGAVCMPFACSPSANACIGDKIGTCAADGQSLSAVSTDCTATANVCTTDLKCAKSALDTIGANESFQVITTMTIVGDVIDVDSTRKLTELQAKLELGTTRDLRWVVYELSGPTFTAKFDKLVTGATGNGFISSGPISYKLTAGKRYLMGVVVSGGDVVQYYDGMPYAADVSFGTATGGVISYYQTSLDVGNVDIGNVTQMKITTEAP